VEEPGFWNRESRDCIKGCGGTWIHAVGSLAGADGWNLTNVAAFPISSAIYGTCQSRIFQGREVTDATCFSCYRPDFQHDL
jgi:hypothetical protein